MIEVQSAIKFLTTENPAQASPATQIMGHDYCWRAGWRKIYSEKQHDQRLLMSSSVSVAFPRRSNEVRIAGNRVTDGLVRVS